FYYKNVSFFFILLFFYFNKNTTKQKSLIVPMSFPSGSSESKLVVERLRLKTGTDQMQSYLTSLSTYINKDMSDGDILKDFDTLNISLDTSIYVLYLLNFSLKSNAIPKEKWRALKKMVDQMVSETMETISTKASE